MSIYKARCVTLDTTSSSVTFDGNWASGDPLFGAARGSMESVFKGSEMIVYGSSSNFGQPFDRTVDGIPANVTLSLWGFECSWKGEVTNDPHIILLNTTQALEKLFSIESVWYLPSPDALPTLGHGEWAVYEHDDPDLLYSGTWGDFTQMGESASATTQSGASANLGFQGNRVIWDGRSPGGGTDGGDQIRLLGSLDQAPTLEVGSTSLAVFPSVDSPEQHYNLSVLRLNTSDTPFAIYHIFVEGGELQLDNETDFSGQTHSSTSFVASPSSSSTPQLPSTLQKVSISGMVGATVGGFVFITCVVLALLWTRNRQKSRRANATLHQPIATFFGPNTSPTIFQKGQDRQDGSTSDVALPPSVHRKGQVPSQSGSTRDIGPVIVPRQHQDSGIRLGSDAASLPPIYTIE
ncbi:hypothetical protein BKA70DRAFT_1567847 [Coprinopsis sp. MPI-PUGE-AT-0042]|nr:hypothetical protein BKA70DRAFT_1567847 [Coprinopsis sp. MPI-PUGE-AT-0042]